MSFDPGSFMQSQTSIYHKLILYIFLLGIFVIVAVSLFSFVASRNAILQRTFNQLTSVRVDRKVQVEQFVNDRIKEIDLFSHLKQSVPFDSHSATTKEIIGQNPYFASLNADFIRYFKTGNYYSALYLIDDKQLVCYKFDSSSRVVVPLSGYYDKILKQIVSGFVPGAALKVQDFSFLPNDSLNHLYIATSLFVNQNITPAMAVFEVRSSAINKIMRNTEGANGLGKSGEVYLVGPDSIMRSNSRFIKNAVHRVKIKNESLAKAFGSDDGYHIVKDYRGVMTLSSYSRLNIPGLNWIILAEIDKKEAMRPVYKLANEIVFLSIFITLILFIAAYIISRSITRPIIDLKNATISVRNGNLEQELKTKSNDELGELIENFNLMTRQLSAQQSELKERELRLFSSFIDGQEDERQRLSRELHDGLGQLIVATKLKTESLINSGEGISTDHVLKLRQMFDSLVDEVRNISTNLAPPVLQQFGLEMALGQICKELSGYSRIVVIFDSDVSDCLIDKRISVYLFRIAQEALNNAIKHSGASEIIVTLIGNANMVSLTIQDDGIGINPESLSNNTGRGLYSLRERVNILNGLIDISKVDNRGTIISVKIPLV